MCIRDRAGPLHQHDPGFLQQLQEELPVILDRVHLGVELRNCLLYTSDAADERSSVDLGGRRIIKKKNKAHADVTGTRSNKSTDSDEHR